MALTLTTTVGCREDFEAPLSGALSEEVDNINKIHETITADTADQLVAQSIPYLTLQQLYLLATGGDVDVDLMSGTTALITITLVAGIPFLFADGSTPDISLGADVDSLLVTNAGTADVTLEGRIGYNN